MLGFHNRHSGGLTGGLTEAIVGGSHEQKAEVPLMLGPPRGQEAPCCYLWLKLDAVSHRAKECLIAVVRMMPLHNFDKLSILLFFF